MKFPTAIPAAVFGLASGLLLSSVLIAPKAHAEDRHVIRACSNATLDGTFGFYRTGTTGAGPLVALGVITYDGKQNFTLTQSISRNGVIQFDVPLVGTYAVADDCTAKGFTADGSEFVRIVIIDGGKGIYLFSESAGNSVYGVGRKTGFPAEPEDD